jgi:hypothetical protein
MSSGTVENAFFSILKSGAFFVTSAPHFIIFHEDHDLQHENEIPQFFATNKCKPVRNVDLTRNEYFSFTKAWNYRNNNTTQMIMQL